MPPLLISCAHMSPADCTPLSSSSRPDTVRNAASQPVAVVESPRRTGSWDIHARFAAGFGCMAFANKTPAPCLRLGAAVASGTGVRVRDNSERIAGTTVLLSLCQSRTRGPASSLLRQSIGPGERGNAIRARVRVRKRSDRNAGTSMSRKKGPRTRGPPNTLP